MGSNRAVVEKEILGYMHIKDKEELRQFKRALGNTELSRLKLLLKKIKESCC